MVNTQKVLLYAATGASIIVDIFALYMGFLLTKCSKIKQWIVFIFYLVAVGDLIQNIYRIYRINKNEKLEQQQQPYVDENGQQVYPEQERSAFGEGGINISTLATVNTVFFVVKIVFFLFVLYRLFTCSSVPKSRFYIFTALLVVETALQMYSMAVK
jgi:hypothetical protein